MTERLVVVGGGPGGLAAARGYREAGGPGEVLLVGAEPYPPYARPPLTKDYLRGSAGPETLPLVPDRWYGEHQVQLRLGTRVVGLDPAARQAVLAGGERLGYTRLVLATGSRPAPLPVPGGDHPDLVYVRDRDSSDRLRHLAPGSRVVVIGAGFIGCEAAASLARRGHRVSLVAPEDRPHGTRLGPEAGDLIGAWLVEVGVTLRLGREVAAVQRAGVGCRVALTDGGEVDAEAVLVGGGAKPDLRLAEAAGLRLDGGGVAVDASMRTSAPDVFAAGDIAYAVNEAAGRPLRVEHWGEAEAQGEIAGTVAAGGSARWAQAPGFWSTIGERTLKYAAWGDGFDTRRFVGGPGSWAVWYGRAGRVVGVLTHADDASYERGRSLVEGHAVLTEVGGDWI